MSLKPMVTALLRDRFNANEILVSLMLVYVADMLLNYLVYGPWKDPQGYNFPQTITFDAVTKIPRLFDGGGLRANMCAISRPPIATSARIAWSSSSRASLAPLSAARSTVRR